MLQPAATSPDFDFVHASGRYDLVPRFLRGDVTKWRTEASIISGTEWDRLYTAAREAIMGGPEWDHHGSRGNGVAWRVDTWELVSTADEKLSDRQYRRVTGSWFPKFYACVVRLRHRATGLVVAVLVVHMPTRNTTRRRWVWDDVAAGMVALILRVGPLVIVAADFNAGWRKTADQALLRAAFAPAGVEFGWAGRVPVGTTISMIDGIAAKGLGVRSSRLLAPASSAEAFHRPVEVGLSLPTITPTGPQEAPVSKAYLIEHPPARRQFKERGTTFSGVCVIHTAESAPDVTGMDLGAEGVAKFIRGRSDPGCYHYLADSDSLIQMVPLSLQTYGDGTGSNPHAVHISAATQAAKWPGLPKSWTERTVKNMARAAHEASNYCFELHGVRIPARRVTKAQSSNRVEGFISHGDRDPGRRTDPGKGFPWALFFAEYERLEGTTPTKETPVGNLVQQGRALAEQACKLLDQARLDGKPRPAVRVMAGSIRLALKVGPKG